MWKVKGIDGWWPTWESARRFCRSRGIDQRNIYFA